MKRESKFQKDLIKEIKTRFPNAIVVKNDSSYIQGIPDLTVNIGLFAFHLEVKKTGNAKHQPNQDWYVNHYLETGGFAAFIYPENKEAVLDAMEKTYRIAREARIPICKPVFMAKLRSREARKDLSK